MCLFVLVLSGMDPLWDTEVCTWTQLDCLWTSSQSKPCFIQNGDKWDCVLCRRLDCPSKYVFEGNYFKWIFSFSASFCWSLSFFPLKLQCYEGKPLFEFDRTRMFRSGLVGFTLHGSLSHYYYQFCEVIIVVHIWPVGLFVYFCRWPELFGFCFQALFPFQDWWVVPAKVAFDQTVWAAIWNSIYFVFLGFLRFESPTNIYNELKTTFWPMLTVRNHSCCSLHLVYISLYCAWSPFVPMVVI